MALQHYIIIEVERQAIQRKGRKKNKSPTRPAPVTPNKDPIVATPTVVPRVAAPAPPIIAAVLAATNGAASPPVNPDNKM